MFVAGNSAGRIGPDGRIWRGEMNAMWHQDRLVIEHVGDCSNDHASGLRGLVQLGISQLGVIFMCKIWGWFTTQSKLFLQRVE